jgi:hypothetical protein
MEGETRGERNMKERKEDEGLGKRKGRYKKGRKKKDRKKGKRRK